MYSNIAIHKGAKTQTQDHAITPINLSTINTIVNNSKKPILYSPSPTNLGNSFANTRPSLLSLHS